MACLVSGATPAGPSLTCPGPPEPTLEEGLATLDPDDNAGTYRNLRKLGSSHQAAKQAAWQAGRSATALAKRYQGVDTEGLSLDAFDRIKNHRRRADEAKARIVAARQAKACKRQAKAEADEHEPILSYVTWSNPPPAAGGKTQAALKHAKTLHNLLRTYSAPPRTPQVSFTSMSGFPGTGNFAIPRRSKDIVRIIRLANLAGDSMVTGLMSVRSTACCLLADVDGRSAIWRRRPGDLVPPPAILAFRTRPDGRKEPDPASSTGAMMLAVQQLIDEAQESDTTTQQAQAAPPALEDQKAAVMVEDDAAPESGDGTGDQDQPEQWQEEAADLEMLADAQEDQHHPRLSDEQVEELKMAITFKQRQEDLSLNDTPFAGFEPGCVPPPSAGRYCIFADSTGDDRILGCFKGSERLFWPDLYMRRCDQKRFMQRVCARAIKLHGGNDIGLGDTISNTLDDVYRKNGTERPLGIQKNGMRRCVGCTDTAKLKAAEMGTKVPKHLAKDHMCPHGLCRRTISKRTSKVIAVIGHDGCLDESPQDWDELLIKTTVMDLEDRPPRTLYRLRPSLDGCSETDESDTVDLPSIGKEQDEDADAEELAIEAELEELGCGLQPTADRPKKRRKLKPWQSVPKTSRKEVMQRTMSRRERKARKARALARELRRRSRAERKLAFYQQLPPPERASAQIMRELKDKMMLPSEKRVRASFANLLQDENDERYNEWLRKGGFGGGAGGLPPGCVKVPFGDEVAGRLARAKGSKEIQLPDWTPETVSEARRAATTWAMALAIPYVGHRAQIDAAGVRVEDNFITATFRAGSAFCPHLSAVQSSGFVHSSNRLSVVIGNSFVHFHCFSTKRQCTSNLRLMRISLPPKARIWARTLLGVSLDDPSDPTTLADPAAIFKGIVF